MAKSVQERTSYPVMVPHFCFPYKIWLRNKLSKTQEIKIKLSNNVQGLQGRNQLLR